MGDMGDYWRDHKEYVKEQEAKYDRWFSRQPKWKREKILKEREEAQIAHEKWVKEFHAELAENQMKKIKNAGYKVELKTSYQLRINGVLDLYPTNHKYHDIKNNKRGRYDARMGTYPNGQTRDPELEFLHKFFLQKCYS